MWGECHAHIFMDGDNYRAAAARYRNGPDPADIQQKLELYKAAGIRFIRDGGDHYGAGLMAREKAKEMGIDYRTPAFAIHKNGHYGAIVGRGFDDLKEYAIRVREAAALGADFIKVMYSGIMDFAGDGGVTGTPLTKNEIFEMVHIAHEEGFAVMAHVNGAQAIIDAIEAGTDSIEHGNFMNDESIRALCEHDTIWVPTHVTISNLLGSDRFDEKVIRRLEIWQAKTIREAWEGGAQIALGSDAGAFRVPHVQGIEDEYHFFTQLVGASTENDRRLAEAQEAIMRRFRHAAKPICMG